MNLTELANKYGTDKGNRPDLSPSMGPHQYTHLYENLFNEFKDKEINFLEIGLERTCALQVAPSLMMWREYFSKAKLYGYDSRDFSTFKQNDTFIFMGDQRNYNDLNKFVDTMCNSFDIIIDDGSHRSSDQQITLSVLFKYVKSGGIYIIEDLCWQPQNEPPRTLDVLNNFINSGNINTSHMLQDDIEYLNKNIERVEIYKPGGCEVGVLYKK